MSVLISPKELHEQLDRVVVLDARGFDAYAAAHISGSFAIDMDAHMSGSLGVHGGRHPLPDMAVLANRLSECDHGFSHRGVRCVDFLCRSVAVLATIHGFHQCESPSRWH